jgi:uncharacterized protein YbaP (TraB family)
VPFFVFDKRFVLGRRPSTSSQGAARVKTGPLELKADHFIRPSRPAALDRAGLVSVSALVRAQAPASTGGNRGLIWTVEKGGRTSWLVGSLHLLTADAYPLPSALDAAFATADVLVEEANPDELKAPAAAMQLVAKAMYPPGTTLQSQVSKDTFDKIAKRAEKIGR